MHLLGRVFVNKAWPILSLVSGEFCLWKTHWTCWLLVFGLRVCWLLFFLLFAVVVHTDLLWPRVLLLSFEIYWHLNKLCWFAINLQTCSLLRLHNCHTLESIGFIWINKWILSSTFHWNFNVSIDIANRYTL